MLMLGRANPLAGLSTSQGAVTPAMKDCHRTRSCVALTTATASFNFRSGVLRFLAALSSKLWGVVSVPRLGGMQ